MPTVREIENVRYLLADAFRMLYMNDLDLIALDDNEVLEYAHDAE